MNKLNQVKNRSANWLNWNWGKSIVLVYTIFVVGMLFLVYQSKQQNLDLVVEDYYAQELKFQDQIDAAQRVHAMGSKLWITTDSAKKFLVISTAKEVATTGTVLAYCASDKRKDLKMKLNSTMSGQWLLPLHSLASGKYLFKINWLQAGVAYYAEIAFEKQ